MDSILINLVLSPRPLQLKVITDRFVSGGPGFNSTLPRLRIMAKTILNNNKLVNIIDTYRFKHPDGGYTWKRGETFSRLDYIFVSKEITSSITTSSVNWSFDNSDHAAVITNMRIEGPPKKGPGIVKINTRILDDPNNIIKVGKDLGEMLGQMDETWNPHIKLEFLKVAIRTVFANNTMEIRNDIRNELKEKEDSLNQLIDLKIGVHNSNKENTRQNDTNSRKLNAINKAIEITKVDISTLRDKISETSNFANRANWYEKGEKSNKYFLNLNNQFKPQKLINRITNNGKEYVGQVEVTKCIKDFYENLYSKQKENMETPDESYYDECPKLVPESKESMEKEVTLDELKIALSSCKDSSPGPDGIPYTVYKKFWDITGPIILNSWKYSIEMGHLPPSQLESAITILPKEGKDLGDIKNWRPITLSNCDLKIITKAISNRMAGILDQIIHESQTAYVPGRSVADNLRSNFYFKSYAESNKIDAALISLDAKKAFDSVDHIYIEKTLKAYGFGPEFIRTFNTLYNKVSSRIIVNGYLSDKINIERGVKQGDALSCGLFILCIDPLLRNLNKKPQINPIVIRNKRGEGQEIKFKAAAYADDVSVICDNNAKSIQEIFREYSRLTIKSGL